jgi:putative two-component system response regulator
MYVEAISSAKRALYLLSTTGAESSEHRARCETNVALALHRLGESRSALEFALRSIANSFSPQNARQAQGKIIREANLVGILLDLGEVTSARQHAAAAKELAVIYPNSRSVALADISVALTNIFCGDSDTGLQQLERLALDKAVQSLPPLQMDTLCALVRAYQEVGRPEEALRSLERMLTLLASRQVASVIEQLEKFGDMGGDSPIRLASANLRAHELEAARLRQKVAEKEVLQSRVEMLERMAIAADIREDISGEHGFRVGGLSALLAREIGWDRDACNALDIAARLHDIGKFGIPEKILLDEKTLRDAEKQFIAAHTRVGAEILSRSDIPQVRIAEEIARCHHEWWDGTGYPKQLKGKDIPRGARIVALADVFDAMTHGRPYAPARPIEEALDLIAGLRGRQFDPELTDHFLALVRRLKRENQELDAYLGKAARNSPFLKARARIKELLAREQDSSGLSALTRPPGVTLN